MLSGGRVCVIDKGLHDRVYNSASAYLVST